MNKKNFQLHNHGLGIVMDYSGLEVPQKLNGQGISMKVGGGVLPTTQGVIRLALEGDQEVRATLVNEHDHGYAQILLEVAPGSRITFIEEFDVKQMMALDITLQVGEGAQLTYITKQECSGGNLFVNREFFIGKDAQVDTFDFQLGAQTSQSYTTQILSGEGSQARTRGVFFGSERQKFDIHTVSQHQASHTASDILVRGVLDDSSHALYRGMVKINKGSQGCAGYQKEDTLLLSPNASVDSIPNLEIANNDVSCSHGVTTSKLSPEKLFYMHSRGMDDESAKKLFVQGHVGEVITLLPEEYQEEFTQAVASKIE